MLRTFARQTLASFKVPRKVLFFTEEELPMTGSNKIRRAELRTLADGQAGAGLIAHVHHWAGRMRPADRN